ncbi:unnamed protein product [Lupinus luteus]|uniref:MINDY deubiquitinase domain-containing protein n=1 Tax=Lupinus luteus TaxID=3873 RepID=A0AAV1WZT7_LUPLU
MLAMLKINNKTLLMQLICSLGLLLALIIGDFEFTQECTIFDLLDIPLCHGWIVDPQDYDTANALGSKSYNALMGELVSLETLNMEVQHKNNPEEDRVDFVAATTAALAVPSPSLSKARPFDDSSDSVSDEIPRKGDLEEEEELLRVLKLSENDSKVSVSDAIVGHANGGAMSVSLDEGMHNKQVIHVDSGDKLEKSTGAGINGFRDATEPSISEDCLDSVKNLDDHISSASILGEAAISTLKTNAINDQQLPNMGSGESIDQNDVTENVGVDASVQNKSAAVLSPEEHPVSLSENCADVSGRGGKNHDQPTLTTSDREVVDDSQNSISNRNSDSSNVRFHQTDVSGALPSTVDGGEPIYQGEECVLDTRTQNFEDHEPVYEGEVVLAEQAEKGTIAASGLRPKDEITPQQGELIKTFLRNNASQLTFYGLRVSLLATDQGYINQPDLVWEKLNEVNGDTVFMTSNFKEFKVEESDENNTWDENNVMTSTADYLANIDSASQAGLDINSAISLNIQNVWLKWSYLYWEDSSDLQLAIALQQQEFEQQPPPRHNSQQPSVSGSSRLVTGPQVARNTRRHSSSSASLKPDGKSKEKCTVM